MISLLNFNPFMPSPGLVFWTVIIFLFFCWIMGKFAFTPIAKALEKSPSNVREGLRGLRYEGVAGVIDFKTPPIVNEGPAKMPLTKPKRQRRKWPT